MTSEDYLYDAWSLTTNIDGTISLWQGASHMGIFESEEKAYAEMDKIKWHINYF